MSTSLLVAAVVVVGFVILLGLLLGIIALARRQ